MKNNLRSGKTSKASILLITLFILFSAATTVKAQKTSIAFLSVETNSIKQGNLEANNMLRVELEKLNKFNVVDKYEIQNLTKMPHFSADSCRGKSCMVEAGRKLGADKVLSASINKFGNKIIIELRLIDVQSNTVEKTDIQEYIDLPDNLQSMIRISLQKIFDVPVNQDLQVSLTHNDNFENIKRAPKNDKLILSGPRIGFSAVTGNLAQRLTASKDNGGWNGYPVMTIFGYQKEIQYLNEGNFLALFEFIPVLAGLDQNMFNPSMSFLHGIRSNKSGWEFALGPNFALAPYSHGYYSDGSWNRLNDGQYAPDGMIAMDRLDRNGDYKFTTSFVFAVGKSFRSGRLNIPLNAYFIPSKDGWRVGFCFGFNSKVSQSKDAQ